MKKSSLNVADYLIDIQSDEPDLCISHLKLQKLLYYCQAYHLAIKDQPLFDEEIQAWKYGPVVENVYQKYKSYKNTIIAPSEQTKHIDKEKNPLPAISISVISQVLAAYGHISPLGLMERTHREDPWIQAYAKGEGTIIPKDTMRTYYKEFLVYPNEHTK